MEKYIKKSVVLDVCMIQSNYLYTLFHRFIN